MELFVESLLSKAMQVTITRNAKTLSPSHVKQCILAETRFDFLRDLVKNIPDVTAAEEREMMSGESSPNSSSRLSDTSVPQRVVRQDSNSSSSSDIRLQVAPPKELKRGLSVENEKKPDTIETAIDLTKKIEEKPVVTANFYQETLLTDEVQHKSVIKVNPTYTSPQPSTSSFSTLTTVEPIPRLEVPKPEQSLYYLDVRQNQKPRTPITPILNIDFTKNFTKPEIKVLDTTVANVIGVKNDKKVRNAKATKEVKRNDVKLVPAIVDVDHLNSGNLQIDEDYDT
ncbi:unnamed protein product [Danaus chrysippus]|uniref:(African queen) hypothetical protein n=1 Tax=Danaus chrysippus TaxID=151541 RepID=A0A8J2QUH4_9NEOP|nr:unnamed protein product [Danaus chrysippus]